MNTTSLPKNQLSRKDFLSKTAAGLAGIAAGTGIAQAAGNSTEQTPSVATAGISGKHDPSGRKVCAIVIGSLRYPVIERLVKEGRMPVIGKMIKEGSWTTELMNYCVNKSHAAVVSAFTGATTGTHRAITILRTKNGDGRPPLTQDLLGKICQSDFIWDAAEAQGKNVIVLNFPDSWPPKIKKGILIGGPSLNVNATLYEGPYERSMGFPVFRYTLAADEIFSTSPDEGWSEMKMVALGQSGAKPVGIRNGYAAQLPLSCVTPEFEILKKPVLWMIVNSKDQQVYIYEDKNWKQPLGKVSAGKWSDRLDMSVSTSRGSEPVAFRVKLLSLNVATREAKLYVSPLGTIRDGRTIPEEGIPELAQLKTFPIAASVVMNRSANLLDTESQRDLLNMSSDWYLDASEVLLKKPFDFFVYHSNDLDWGEHAVNSHYRRGLSREKCIQFVDDLYADVDKQIARLLTMLPDNTDILLMSPHGLICPWDIKGSKGTDQILAEAGLLIRKSTGEIDYGKSIAFSAPEGEGLVNVNPWTPDTPEKALEREKNIQKAMAALSSAIHPETGERIFSVVLPWEAAAPFGLHSEKQADILAMKPALYGGIHGPCYPLTANNENTLKGVVICHGPSIKEGFRETRPVNMEDITPTLAYLMGIKPPIDSEGKVLYRILK
jgi:predicted AlkP superfamily phosphohydrolase/phosphomutase